MQIFGWIALSLFAVLVVGSVILAIYIAIYRAVRGELHVNYDHTMEHSKPQPTEHSDSSKSDDLK